VLTFVQYYLECLSQASYLVGDLSTGRAAVVDPRRDITEYVRDAAAAGLSIEFVVETHFHADFLSGHLELAEATGATILLGAAADAHFPHRPMDDGERVVLGDVVLEFRATPGHTPESVSIVVWEHAGDTVPYGVLTGDTLFIGDVGRPDLAAGVVRVDEAGRQLYESLHTKLMVLPDATRVFPGHGAGSACGKNLSTATASTIGEQRAGNYALQPMSVEAFVALVTEGQRRVPDYFGYDASMNREPHALLSEEAPPGLSLAEVLDRRNVGAVVLDTRPFETFGRGHVRGSVNVGVDGRFAEYAGMVLDPTDEIVLVCEPGAERESKIRLGRIGFDNVIGALTSPVDALTAHPDVVAIASRLAADQLHERMRTLPDLVIVDVRGPGERAAGAIERSVSIPLAELRSRVAELDPDRPVVVYCAGGYRSSIAASYLRARGYSDVSDLIGGYGAWQVAAATKTIVT
jgi:hydroxyacylglutathione hydrolase